MLVLDHTDRWEQEMCEQLSQCKSRPKFHVNWDRVRTISKAGETRGLSKLVCAAHLASAIRELDSLRGQIVEGKSKFDGQTIVVEYPHSDNWMVVLVHNG